ncbi:MAG TPA: immunoglobulin-like domain-containing protein, partial [Paludibacter sp.]|nr:immunoglobulin-like domain-containing protein [Paludibacter sp.]
MKKTFYLIALCLSWVFALQTQAANVIPQAGKFYNIVQTPSNMVVGAVGVQPVVQTATNALSQAFEFIPVEGKPDTYYIKTYFGMYLNKVASSGWNMTYLSAPDAANVLNAEWVITDDASSTTVFRLLLNANNKYVATDNVTTNSNLYCDKAADHVRGLFTLVEAVIPTNLVAAYNALTLGDVSSVTSNITLPVTSGPTNIPVIWTSTLPLVVATDGTVTQPDKYDASVKLTATMSDVVNGVTFTLTKDFFVTVKAKTVADDLLANWDFAQDSIYIENGETKVKSSASTGFIGTVMNDASIRTIGNTKKYNVLYTGNGSGYFDMGAEIGKATYSLTDYTMAGYFRIDADYATLNNNGNFIWTFSNSADSPTDKNGYIIGSLKNQSQSVTYSYWATGDQSVGLNTNAPKDGWHHIAFTQKGNTGTIYIDGAQVAQNTSMTNLPST